MVASLAPLILPVGTMQGLEPLTLCTPCLTLLKEMLLFLGTHLGTRLVMLGMRS
jgi:hypothetical protein